MSAFSPLVLWCSVFYLEFVWLRFPAWVGRPGAQEQAGGCLTAVQISCMSLCSAATSWYH